MFHETQQTVALEFMSEHTADAARVLETYSIEEFAPLLAAVPVDIASAVLARMNPALVFRFTESLNAADATRYLSRMPLIGALPVLRRCDKTRLENILAGMPRDAVSLARRILRYPPAAMGSLANPHACTLPPDISIRNGAKRLRTHPTEIGEYVYVVDRQGKFCGYVRLHDFFRGRLRDRIDSIMKTNMTGLSGYAMPDDAIQHPDWQRFHELPVLGDGNEFTGSLDHRIVLAGNAANRNEAEAAVHTAVQALDDLYRIGFSGMLKGVGGALLQGNTE